MHVCFYVITMSELFCFELLLLWSKWKSLDPRSTQSNRWARHSKHSAGKLWTAVWISQVILLVMLMDYGMTLNAMQHVMEVTWPAARVSLDNTCPFTVQILGISVGASCSYNTQPWWDACWGGLVGACTEPKFLLCCNWTCDVFTVSSNVMTCSMFKVCLHCRGSCCYRLLCS